MSVELAEKLYAQRATMRADVSRRVRGLYEANETLKEITGAEPEASTRSSWDMSDQSQANAIAAARDVKAQLDANMDELKALNSELLQATKTRQVVRNFLVVVILVALVIGYFALS